MCSADVAELHPSLTFCGCGLFGETEGFDCGNRVAE